MSIPPLAALRAFEAVARHLSFTRAAEELGMTQAAVSYQIRLLEERLATPLFLRKPRGIVLTETGALFARPTIDAFDMLREAYADPSADSVSTLSISTVPTFAGAWLSPRLGKFQMNHPNLAVRLETADNLVDFGREDITVAIRAGEGGWPGLEAHCLMPIEYTPMLSPELAKKHELREPADLLKLPLLDRVDPNWAVWMREAGVDFREIPPKPGLTLSTDLHEARAALEGYGVALLTPRFFRFELATGGLIQPFPLVAQNGRSYWLVYPTGRRNRPSIRKFRAFLLDEIARDPG
ncbi:LysR family transcriptional regulator [Paracoccus versutus]|uniref:LysR family glycine cleavage system transcriptional activator n=1 Tax=Paracoccus versutus TaxID=34007 RepID=A0AAQ0KM32_PARVE|nr:MULTISPECIES: LysR substrate-binding domain-containing protein [Paracoccus]WGR60498.1 LysR family transcriptional regulator [Paracoccus ferrooxidans]SFY39506.1 LysR family transcriptional regulator, glycine cleavage system transcriptional activator [Paracoccus pantotrophus]KGJ12326.1 LysR family transcriptional regulator [Paracoccus versutus]MCJ1901582.1 LysR substrate-binding domain-containing protein [Paracoccus versutus]MDF3905136.1 LysR substrate-binding domain-containing protein [Parac